MENPLVLEFLAALARWALAALGGALVAHHVITAPQSDKFTDAIVAHLALWIPLGVSAALALWSRYQGRRKLMAALSLPTGSTEQDAKEKAQSGVPIPSVSTPPNTVPRETE